MEQVSRDLYSHFMDPFTQQVRRFHAVILSSLPSDSLSFPRFFIYIEAYTSDQVNSAYEVPFVLGFFVFLDY